MKKLLFCLSIAVIISGYATSQTLDFIPAVNPFINEACQTSWDNLSAIATPEGLLYWSDIPDYTALAGDIDKNRFTWFWQIQSPWTFEFEIFWRHWMLLPVDDYGNAMCQGIQLLKVYVLDELTGQWYYNEQVVYAGFLCEPPDPAQCEYGYQFSDIQYEAYDTGYNHLSNTGPTQ